MHDPAFPAWMAQVQAMPAQEQIIAVSKKLMELNPGFDGLVTDADWKGTPKIESGVVTELGFFTDNVSDISPVRALTGLKGLTCNGGKGRGKLSDLTPLMGMSLTQMNCQTSQVSDLSPLEGMPLKVLNCKNTSVSDLSPLRGMPLLDLVSSFTKVSDLKPLQDCKSLNKVDVKDTPVGQAAVAALQKALPNCKIEWDDPAKATTPQPAASGTK